MGPNWSTYERNWMRAEVHVRNSDADHAGTIQGRWQDTKSPKHPGFKHWNLIVFSHSSDATFIKQASDKLASLRGATGWSIQPTSQLFSSHYTLIRWHLIPQWTCSVTQHLQIQSRLSFGILNKPKVNLSRRQKAFHQPTGNRVSPNKPFNSNFQRYISYKQHRRIVRTVNSIDFLIRLEACLLLFFS